MKNIGILTVSNFASKILVFLLVPLYTSVLSTEEYGTYDLAVSTISLLFPILSLNIVDAVMRFMMDKECDNGQIANIGVKFIVISTIIFSILTCLYCSFNISNMAGFQGYIIAYYLFYALNQFFIQLAKGLDKVKEMGIAGVLGTSVMIVLNIIFLCLFKWGLSGFFMANILSNAAPAIYLFVVLKGWRYFLRNKINYSICHQMLLYCTPLIASVVGWWVNSGSDKYVVTFFCGVAANGVLSVAYKIPSILNTFQSIFIQAWQISAVKEYGERDNTIFYGQTFCVINIMMCVVASGLILFTRPLAHFLYANEFYVAWKFVPFLLVSSVLNCASGFLGPILSAKKDSKSMAISAVYGAGVNIVLNIIFVYAIGAQGVTIATVIASYIIYHIRKRAVSDDITIEKYNNTIITWGLLCLQAVLEVYVKIYWLEIILILIILVVNRKLIMSILKRIRKLFLK